jgi:hypothetical protein
MLVFRPSFVNYCPSTFSPVHLPPFHVWISGSIQSKPQSRQSAKLFLQLSELGLPQPLTCRRVCPSPPVLGGGAHSLAIEGLGEFQFWRRGHSEHFWYSLYICSLWEHLSAIPRISIDGYSHTYHATSIFVLQVLLLVFYYCILFLHFYSMGGRTLFSLKAVLRIRI